MSLVILITVILTALIAIVMAGHFYSTRHLVDRWAESDDSLSPLVACPPVSVIVVSQNEGRDMEVLVPQLIKQKGVDVEVVVVNAASTDTTLDAIKRLSLQYSQMRQTYVPTSNTSINLWESGCMLGARAARNEWLLYVHPTFTPPSALWILDLLRYIDPSAKAVIDYGHTTEARYIKEKKRGWNKRVKKMTQTVLQGRAIEAAGGSILIKKDWLLNHTDRPRREECIYVCRRFNPLQRLILRVRNHRPTFLAPW